MVQIIDKSGEDTFGRLGRSFGQGLAEQVPKEVDRYRLSKGLQQFEKDSPDLSPIQQLSRLSAIPGITPQMIQSFSELAKQQNTRNAYAKKAGEKPRPSSLGEQSSGPSIQDVKFGNFDNSTGKSNRFTKDTSNLPFDESQPPINPNNPLRPESISKKPWTAERRNQEIARIFEDFPQLTNQEAQAMASDYEARELAQPQAEQQIDRELNEKQKDLQEKFNTQLLTKLEKTGAGPSAVYKDITGENLVNLQRGMERDLRANPKANVDDIINRWTTKALDLAKAKSQLKTTSSGYFLSKIFSNEKYKSKLNEYQRIFADSGNLEEFSNILKSKDFEMSPQGAASIAYPRTNQIKSYVSKISPKSEKYPQKNSLSNSRKYATEIQNLITPKDNLLAIAWDLRSKDPYFNQNAFFQQLQEDQDEIGLTERQRRELAEGSSDILPSWGDIVYLPLFGG